MNRVNAGFLRELIKLGEIQHGFADLKQPSGVVTSRARLQQPRAPQLSMAKLQGPKAAPAKKVVEMAPITVDVSDIHRRHGRKGSPQNPIRPRSPTVVTPRKGSSQNPIRPAQPTVVKARPPRRQPVTVGGTIGPKGGAFASLKAPKQGQPVAKLPGSTATSLLAKTPSTPPQRKNPT